MKSLNKIFTLTMLLFIFSGCNSTSTSGNTDSQKESMETSKEETSSSYHEGQIVDDIKKTSDYLSFNKIIDSKGNEYTPSDDIKKLVGNYQFIKETDFGGRVQFFLTIHKDGSFISNFVTDMKSNSEYNSEKYFYFDKSNRLHQSEYSNPESILKTGVIMQAYGNYYLQALEQLQLPLAYNQEGNLTINYLNPQLYYEKEFHNGVERELDNIKKGSDDTIAFSDNSVTVNIADVIRRLDTSDGGGAGGEGDNAPLTKIDKQNEFAKRSVFQFEKYVQKNKTKFQQIENLNDLLIMSNSTKSENISSVNPDSLKGYTVDNKQPKLKYALSEDVGNGIIYYTATDGKYLYNGVNDTEPIEWDSTPLFE